MPFLAALHKPQMWQLSHNLHVQETEAQDTMFCLLKELEDLVIEQIDVYFWNWFPLIFEPGFVILVR